MKILSRVSTLIDFLAEVTQSMTNKTVEENIKRLQPPYSTKADYFEACELNRILTNNRVEKHIKSAVVQAVLSGKSLRETKQLYEDELNTRIDL